MKTLYLIGGPMGVGKTTVGQCLKGSLENSVFLDGDWCWDAHPFQVTEETKAIVMDNICHTLNNFLSCSAYENVIFCWVMDRQKIIDELLKRLDTKGCKVISLSLICCEKDLTERLEKDVGAGLREEDVIRRSLERLPRYTELSTRKLNTTGKTPMETAEEICRMAGGFS